MTRHAKFVTLIENEAAARGISPRTLCKYAVGNNRLYKHLQNAGTCTLDVMERFEAYVADNPAPQKETGAA